MKKAGTVILSVITFGTLVLSFITDNIEIFNGIIKPEWLTIASSLILAIKLFYDQSGLFTAEEVAQFANHDKENSVYTKGQHTVNAKDVENWKLNK